MRVVDEQGRPVAGQGPVSVAPVEAWNGVTVRSSEWDLLVQGVEADGEPASLNRSGHLEVEQGRGLATRGSGFAPGTPVGVYVLGWDEPLGVITTDDQGGFTARVDLPASVPVGTRTVQVTGRTSQGHVLVVSLGIQVVSASQDPLIGELPERVEVMHRMRVVRGGADVLVEAGSRGCSAVDERLVFWGVGTCRIQVRDDAGRVVSSHRIAIEQEAAKVERVRPLRVRKVAFDWGRLTEQSIEMLARIRPKVVGSAASYIYWMDSRDRARTAAVTRMHAQVTRELSARRMRTIVVADSWQERFKPGAFTTITIAWLPEPR